MVEFSEEEVEQGTRSIRQEIARRLGREVDAEEVSSMSLGDVREFMDEIENEQTSSTSEANEEQADDVDPDRSEPPPLDEEDMGIPEANESGDTSSIYRAALSDAYELAKQWEARFGDEYVAFVEHSWHGLWYGVDHVNDSGDAKFAELTFSEKVVNELGLRPSMSGAVYRWALAQWKRLRDEAEHEAEKRKTAIVDYRDTKFVIQNQSTVFTEIEIPRLVRQMLRE